jgi:hypothetical protein
MNSQQSDEDEVDRLRAALVDLLEEARDMRSYVPEYFAKKWKHDEALERAAMAIGPYGAATAQTGKDSL